MEFTTVEGLRTLKLDLVLTLALASVFLFVGYALQRRLGFLSRASVPAPAIGGLLFALVVLLLRSRGTLGVALDTSLRAPLQTAFFTTIGLGATLGLLRAGGWRMGFFWLIASGAAVVQNVFGVGLARAVGAPDALGVICGSLTLTGGPATGLAFTETFEQLGIAGAGALIIASATFGIFTSSLVGNPVASWLIKRLRLAPARGAARPGVANVAEDKSGENIIADIADEAGEGEEADPSVASAGKEDAPPLTGYVLLRNLAVILVVMGAGALVSLALAQLGARLPPSVGKFLTLPGYIGAMLVAAVVRNVDDRARLLKLDARAVEFLGTIALALFLVIALMDLRLWQLAGLAVPMLVILAGQVVLMIAFAVFVTFVLMGRDYEAAVTAGGHIGFGLGVTPNAVANMEALVERHGPAPRSFLIVPVVGAFFIDFSNALVIGLFVNLYTNFAR
ncbi:MAG TPA: sodium/glutamate symporter [Pyrinomonadaceae bacterium]|nr:sodium/glutamate symporter [Pyrinomonadaceae bacterium]